MPYQWYQILFDKTEGDLQQGDFIPLCPIIIPPEHIEEGNNVEVTVQKINSIILSQSCDLVNSKINNVLVCPYYPLKVFTDNLPPDQKNRKSIERIINNLRQGNLPGYHLLNKCPEVSSLSDYQVVDFRNVYGVNFSFLQSLVENVNPRITLLPPYREHLSQAFARFFMRVGLPQDIRVEDITLYTSK